MNKYPQQESPPYPAVATHMPVLWTVLRNAEFDHVYEFGAGAYSTPLLAEMTKQGNAWLHTGENDLKWIPQSKHERHSVQSIPHLLSIMKKHRHRTIGFIDCEAPLRGIALEEMWSAVDIAIVHDTEVLSRRAYPNLSEQIKRWVNRIDVKCPFHNITTTVLFFPWSWVDSVITPPLNELSNNQASHLSAWWEICRLLKWENPYGSV